METHTYHIRGKVQNVMFRQTLIRAALNRGLRGGATNEKPDKHLVSLTLSGQKNKIDEIINFLKSGQSLNSWHAQAQSVNELPNVIPIEQHQVTTDNVDQFHWNPSVQFYLN
ncbi:MAG: putative Acylphosphatase family protein [Streblomastix strix]|uniref:acylphosphatase n=1 Tax=Streblomastix strix TaxID=222440 RepID=A0A5J4X7V1_9EUKA|nr:MAG: putative Acylphosphatase family protein [Streblomastix strix]